MKKLITLSVVLALAVAGTADAKRRYYRSSKAKTPATQPAEQKPDAAFTNTPNAAAAQAPAKTGTVANVAAGAAAGYILGSATAQANPAQQAVPTEQKPGLAEGEFRSVGGEADPFLVEKTEGYRRYCIAGVQYLAPAISGQAGPIVMVNPNGSPLACRLVP